MTQEAQAAGDDKRTAATKALDDYDNKLRGFGAGDAGLKRWAKLHLQTILEALKIAKDQDND